MTTSALRRRGAFPWLISAGSVLGLATILVAVILSLRGQEPALLAHGHEAFLALLRFWNSLESALATLMYG